MKFLLVLLTLASLASAQLKNSYGYPKWALIGTASVLVDTTGRTTWKSVGTADTGKAFYFGQSNGDYTLSWTHGSNGDDSGSFSIRWLCYDTRVAAWVDTARYTASAAFTLTKFVSTTRDTLPGMAQGKMFICDSLKPVINGNANTNKSDTVFIRKMGMRSIILNQTQVK